MRGEKERPEDLGYSLAERLLDSGADKILASVYGKINRRIWD